MRRDKELTLEITNQCTLNCAWCSSGASPSGLHTPLNSILTTLRAMQPRCKTVRLSGGEPTLHPDLSSILIEAHRLLGYHVVLFTNGQAFLPPSISGHVDEFVVHLVNSESYWTALAYKHSGRNVSLHVVAVEGMERDIQYGIQFALNSEIPIHILALQKQGRGKDCEPSKLITWSGEKGCSEKRKVTVLSDGAVVTCSAMKRKCDIR